MNKAPSENPPSYEEAAPSGPSSYQHRTANGIPPASRRSMEDEHRQLPSGWVRQFDEKEHHQFFVDTNQDPPRSIWHHPYDDEQYLASLSPDERDNFTRLNRSVSLKDIEAESSDDESHPAPKGRPPVAGAEPQPHGLHKYARKLKDRITHSTHEQREVDRQKRAEEEQRLYQMHLAIRQATARAVETGRPQFLAKGKDGRDIYVESPYGSRAPDGAMGYNPYGQQTYADPRARYIRPQTSYYRPYGYGYGGGLGLPLMGGLMGGALLGGALF